MVKLLSARACAKINLFLRVTGRRADGYHELDSIFVPISLCDRIAIEIRPAASQSVTLRCNVGVLANPETNLASRAARAFLAAFDLNAHVIIDLTKHIPAGAGLGGGSSDAGTVLAAMAALNRTHIPQRLAEIAVELGADVPFFLDPRPARVTGIGEKVVPIIGFPKLHLVIAVPPAEVPTAAVFKALKSEAWSGAAPQSDIAEIVAGRVSRAHLVNDLAAPAMELYPEIAKLKLLLEAEGALAAQMTGSGGAVFGIFRDAAEADRAAKSLSAGAPEARVFAAESL
jgi:4-diphosphocytidyl-2-C-methyl-D-erythritol kinase